MKDYKSVMKNTNAIKKALGLRGDIAPGDITMKAKQVMTPKSNKARDLPSSKTKIGLAIRGLI